MNSEQDTNLRKEVLENVPKLLKEIYAGMEEQKDWGPNIKTEENKWDLCVDLLRLGLFGSFIDDSQRPTRDELIAASGMTIVSRKKDN